MKKFIERIGDYTNLYRDDQNGIAWIEDGSTGLGFSVHANISRTGSVKGMKDRGYWRKSDRTIRSHGWIYNIDTFVCDKNSKLEMIVADACRCQGCLERRDREHTRKWEVKL